MDDFQKSLLRLMTSNLSESERIQLIGQLQFAIVLLQKQQQQFEEKREKERSLQLAELNKRANGFNNGHQQHNHQFTQSDHQRGTQVDMQMQKHQCQQTDEILDQTGVPHHAQHQRIQYQHPHQPQHQPLQQSQPQLPPQNQSIQQHDSTPLPSQNVCPQQAESTSIMAPSTPIMHTPLHSHRPQEHLQHQQGLRDASCGPSDCMTLLSAPPSIGDSEQHHLNLHMKNVSKHETDSLTIKCTSTLEDVLSAPPHHLLQQRDEETTTFTYFHGESDECRENQGFTTATSTEDPLDNFDQSSERWTPHKVELHENGAQDASMIPFCSSEIEVVQLTATGGKTGNSTPNSGTGRDVEGSDGNHGDTRMLLPSLYSSDPTLTAFSDSPRDTEDDPLLAPITLEGEEISIRSHQGDTDLVNHRRASDFPPLRVSLRSKRKARKPRRMTPQEDVDEDDMLSPYHVCPICNLVWRRTNDYVCHLIGHSPAAVTCAQCKGTFENEALLRSHECFDANQSLYFRRLCGYCGTCFVNKKAFNRHKRTSHAFATAITCNYCQRTFYSTKPYYAHLEANHVTKGWRVCRKCGQVLENDTCLRQHMKANHSRGQLQPPPPPPPPPPTPGSNGNVESATETSTTVRTIRSRRLPFKCSYCIPKHEGDGVEAFATRAELRDHVNRTHQIRCDDCGKIFRTAACLQKHRQVSHNQPSAAKRRRIGKSMASPEPPPPKDGIVAEMELAQQALDEQDEEEEEDILLTDHEDEDEDEEEEDSVISREPGRGSKSRQGRQKRLTNHNNTSKSTNQRRAARSRARARRQCNSQLNGYKCRFCPSRFHAFSVYREHLQLNHADQVKAGECKECQQVFLSQASLEKHRMTRTHLQKTGAVKLERRHLCELCGKAYLRHQVLQRHMKTHINDYEFRCPHCEFKAVEKSNLKAHLSRHFNIKPFSCDKCDAKFTSRRSLKDHCKFKHSDSRDYYCETCGMGFKTPGTLSRHKKGHSTEKPFVCFCGVQFNRLSNLRRHLKSVHQTDDTVLPVKRLKKFTNGGVENVNFGNSTPQPEPPIQQQTPSQQQLVSIHISSEPSPPPASVMHNLQPLPASPPVEDTTPQVEDPRTPQLPEENDEDSTHAVLHSFLNSSSDQPHISSASVADPSSSLLVHQTAPHFCQTSVTDGGVSTVASSAPTGPMLRSLVGVGDPVQTVPAGTHIWRPMGSESTPCVTPTTSSDNNPAACTIVSSVNCVLDSATSSSGNALPFDDVLWSSAVLPQTSAVAGPSGNAPITYLLSGGTNSNVSLVGQSESSPMLFTTGGVNGPVTSSNGELTSTLMISHLTADPLGLHGLTGSLVSPTLQSSMNGVGMSSAGGHLGSDPQHSMHNVPHPHQQHPIQQPVPVTGHQCSDFSVCYLIGGQSHVK